MDKSNHVINGLWIGKKLSPLELLTLYSFIECGHVFHLWVYEKLNNILPPGVILRDANEIIPFTNVFSKKNIDPSNGIGKGSFGAPFSDLFRYKLLYEKGGWWVDMDVTCFKPLDFKKDFFFRSHPLLPMIGNIMKCPPKSSLMKLVYEEVKRRCSENTKEWLLPNKILNKHIQQLGLQSYIQNETSNNDDWLEIEGFIYTNKMGSKNWFYIHWMNEEWRTRKLKKNVVIENSFLHNLYIKYSIPIQTIDEDYSKKYAYKIRRRNRRIRSLIKNWLGIKK